MFDSADVEGVGELDEYEVVRLMKKLNNSLATVKIQQKLKVPIVSLSFPFSTFVVQCSSYAEGLSVILISVVKSFSHCYIYKFLPYVYKFV